MGSICNVCDCPEYNPDRIAGLIANSIHVNPGDKVFIKPNWVIHPFKGKEDRWIATTTNSAVIEAVLIVLKQKLDGKGRVVIGDSPMGQADIARIHARTNITAIVDRYRTNEFQIDVIDIRNYYLKTVNDVVVRRISLKGDPRGNCRIELGSDSAFADKGNKQYAFVDDMHPVSDFHDETHNCYVVSQSVLDCDLFINLPKLKTHRSAGMTCAMKNLVGITANKNSVPHRTTGCIDDGGDSYPTLPAGQKDTVSRSSRLRQAVRRIKRLNVPYLNYLMIPAKLLHDWIYGTDERGYWHGNDTIWRSVLDLNRILRYCDQQGNMQDTVQRRYVCIVDAVIAGERQGPLIPTPKECGLLLIADNPVAMDTVACKLMGFNPDRLPLLNAAYRSMRWPLVDFARDDVRIVSTLKKWNGRTAISVTRQESFQFVPVRGWQGVLDSEQPAMDMREPKDAREDQHTDPELRDKKQDRTVFQEGIG